jgi:D-alanyl-lipoteichoic acid acyltransferase DltB (MBOAT superfamily)
VLFPTLEFGIFFLLVFVATWLLRDRLDLRKGLLLAVSYFFYGYWDWRFLGLLALSSAVNYAAGIALVQSAEAARRKWVVGAAVALNLLVLGFFKYYGFFLTSLADLLASMGLQRDLPWLDIVLPVGISFFTFQGISYVIDVYRGEVEPVRSPLDMFLYISFFPQLVAGPIVRAAHFLPQLQERPRLDHHTLALGFLLILIGLFKKMVVAGYLATEIVDEVFVYPQAYSSLDLLAGAYAFVVQIYCDFSGYSDIAIGVAALLGYRFKRNFDRPLSATSLQDLWQRWHISLTSWLRDYLYRPLKGSRRGQAAMHVNLAITMLIAGLWHGAAWTFVIWGGLQGALLVLERSLKGAVRRVLRAATAPAPASPPPGVAASAKVLLLSALDSPPVGWFVTFNVFALAGIFFRAPELSLAMDYFGRLLSFTAGLEKCTPFVALLIAFSVATQFLPGDLVPRLARRTQALGPVALGLALGGGILAIEMIGPGGIAPFIYFQF